MKGLDFMISIAPAIAGGFARYFHDINTNGHKFNWGRFGMQLSIAGFVGWITISLIGDIPYFQARENLKGAIIGISSFLSPNILTIMEKRLPNILDNKVKRLK